MSTAPKPPLSGADKLRDDWKSLPPERRIAEFEALDREEAVDFFVSCDPPDQAQVVSRLPRSQQQLWLRLLPPDDAADVIQHIEPKDRDEWLELLDESTAREVRALLAYAKEEAGGIMNPRFARVPPEMNVDDAIRYLRRQTREEAETIYYVFAVDEDQRLHGVVSFRELFEADSHLQVEDVMTDELVTVPEGMDQEEVARLFDVYDLIALPVVDENDHIQGIVTFDDIVDVVREEATEDVQKIGGMEALENRYLDASLWEIVKKRGGWLAVLFLGLLLTASAIEFYEEALSGKGLVLTAFIPLIIASGGNSGAQASTLVIRAIAVGDVQLGDWWRVLGREALAGLTLGALLAVLGFSRIFGWQLLFDAYELPFEVALTVGLSLIGVVVWGTLAGALLPFVLERLDFDPASASVPLLATIVDLSGLLIYFNVARVVFGDLI